jgi:hypothetical protein
MISIYKKCQTILGTIVANFSILEQMKTDGLSVVTINYDDKETPESVKQTHPILYLDGDSYCCLLGPDPEAGIFGCGPTPSQALQDFDTRFQHLLAHPVKGDPVSEFIQHRHI